jgi:NADP-dependent 3-hydroxy acid dehydrogenase YdfG
MKKLEEKVAIITGGSSGIGLATAERFVSEGAYLFITGRRQSELDAAVKQIGKNNVTGVQGMSQIPQILIGCMIQSSSRKAESMSSLLTPASSNSHL